MAHVALQRWNGNDYENTDKCEILVLDEEFAEYYNRVFDTDDLDTYCPAWSLHRLIEMIPDKIAYPTIYDSAPLRISKNSMYYLHRFFDKNGDEDFSTVGDDEAMGSHNVFDYAVSVIGFLIKEGYFSKEYLEE